MRFQNGAEPGLIGCGQRADSKNRWCSWRGRRSIGWIVALSRRRLRVRVPSSPLAAHWFFYFALSRRRGKSDARAEGERASRAQHQMTTTRPTRERRHPKRRVRVPSFPPAARRFFVQPPTAGIQTSAWIDTSPSKLEIPDSTSPPPQPDGAIRAARNRANPQLIRTLSSLTEQFASWRIIRGMHRTQSIAAISVPRHAQRAIRTMGSSML